MPICQLTVDESDYRDGEIATVCGIVQTVLTKATRNNSLMAYVTLEDDTGAIEVLVFSAVLRRAERLLQEGSALAIAGRVSLRDEKPTQLMANDVLPLERFARSGSMPLRALNRISPCQKLYLKLPSEDSLEYQKTRAILNMFPGQIPTVLYFADTGVRRGAQCSPEAVMLEELQSLLGEAAVAER